MKSKMYMVAILSVILIFATGVERNSLAKEAQLESKATQEVHAAITPLMSYQGRLLEGGNPVTGTRAMTFKLYNVSSEGTEFWSETQSVNVINGLFQAALGSITPFNGTVLGQMDQNLWLEITVAGNTLPRQQLMGAPYALSLAPGAAITGSMPSSLLSVVNESSGAGVKSEGNGVGLFEPALKAEAKNTSGIAAWVLSNSWDATLVTSNSSNGPLIKGFGGDGGEHEFIILNDGTFQQEREASGLVKAAVYALCASPGATIVRSFNNVGGSITIIGGGSVGSCVIDFGFQVDDRYFTVTATAVEGYNQDSFATCGVPTGFPNKLVCWRETHAGMLNEGYIMVLVY